MSSRLHELAERWERDAPDEPDALPWKRAMNREARRYAAELRAELDAPSDEAVAYLHTLHMECGQVQRIPSLDSESPFGVAGEDYSGEYHVTTVPLYARALDAPRPGWHQYETDDNRVITHRRSDGAVRLAIAMLDGVTDPGLKKEGE
jgi:hypothetical protein